MIGVIKELTVQPTVGSLAFAGMRRPRNAASRGGPQARTTRTGTRLRGTP